ncbi:hypothetical protein L1987_22415 [Smallanthus sonchifolius]|uniref:Uncharacterized protein n=1 Tax=Smallanthus sonchifolius TaxID=185202 RepID=A0ACB9IG66_9ASTR|nr:hypothetical protein L1987_22415 [Smallanthus sonchifolius]
MPDYQAGYFTLFLICMISSILILNLYKSSRVKPHLPPTPFRLPIIGHLHLLGRIPHQAFHKLSNRHGPFMKKIIMSELLNGKTLDFLYPVRSDEINRFIKYLSQKAKDGKCVELEGMKLTSNMISRSFMSKRCSEEEDKSEDITKIIAETTEIAGSGPMERTLRIGKAHLNSSQKDLKEISWM